MSAKHEQQSVTDDHVWWSVDKAALHLGCTRTTILRYIREGLPLRHKLINREELLGDYQARQIRQTESRATRRTQ